MNEEKGENHESKTGRGHRPAAGAGPVVGGLREKHGEAVGGDMVSGGMERSCFYIL